MKAKRLDDGNIKVWYDNEVEFIIVGKDEQLIDTIIDAKLLEKKYSKMLVEEVRSAGLDAIHDAFIDIDDSLQSQIDKMKLTELDKIFDAFNSIFHTSYRYHINDNGLISILFGRFDNYQDFVRNYFGTFLLKLFAFKVDLPLSVEKNNTIKGLSVFISRFADDYFKTYLEASRKLKFNKVNLILK